MILNHERIQTYPRIADVPGAPGLRVKSAGCRGSRGVRDPGEYDASRWETCRLDSATGNGSEITLACDMSFASREKAIISQWEVGVGMVAGGGPMARLPGLIGRNRALEVLLSSEDIRADQAEAYGYINRALPDADLDAFVEALATRIARFDKWAIAQTKRLVNTSLPPDVELGAGWDACIASLGRPAAQDGIKALMARAFHKPGDVENRLGYYLGEIAR